MVKEILGSCGMWPLARSANRLPVVITDGRVSQFNSGYCDEFSYYASGCSGRVITMFRNPIFGAHFPSTGTATYFSNAPFSQEADRHIGNVSSSNFPVDRLVMT